MGGGGKKGGGGGGGQAPQVQVPAGIFQTAATGAGLGQYASSLLDPLAGMTNWASALATGGQAGGGGGAGGQIQPFRSQAIQAGPNVDFHGTGKPWSTSFDPTTGLITFTNPSNARQTFMLSPDQAQDSGLPSNILDQWRASYSQNQASGAAAQGAANATWGSIGQQYGFSQGDIAQFEAVGLTPQSMTQWGDVAKQGGYSWRDVINFKQAGLSPSQVAGGARTYQQALGPMLGQTWADIQQQQAATGKLEDLMKSSQDFTSKATQEADLLRGLGQQQMTAGGDLLTRGGGIIGEGTGIIGEGEAMLRQAMTTGLFPGQAAMLEQAKRTQEQNVEAALGGMGLGRSTQKEQLKGQADLAAAAAGGALVQGNISAAQEQMKLGMTEQGVGITEQGVGISEQQIAQQQFNLAQAAEKLALAGQELTLQEQGALVTELQSIGAQSMEMQKNLWAEAMSGYGAIGSILQQSTQSYGLSLDAYKAALQAELENAQISAKMQADQQSADASSSSSLFGALGNILGGGKGGGGLLGGLGGSLFGTGIAAGTGAGAAGTVGGFAAGAAGASAGAAGSLGTLGIGAALTVIFCSVAQEVYGVEGWQWIVFQRWLLFRAPKWLRALYAQHALWFAAWIKDRPRVKSVLRFLMNFIVNDEFA